MEFLFPEDRQFFKNLLGTEGEEDFLKFYTLFDFRPPAVKRAEFNKQRNRIFAELEKYHGKHCMLNYELCDPSSGFAVDHLIPLSTNKLNKELRQLKAETGKKVATQGFGSNHLDNLVIACTKCNNHKKHRFLESEKLREILELKKRVEPL